MPTADEYRQMVRRLRRPGLLRLWTQIQSGSTPGWDSGKAFEYLVLRAFEIEGANVAWPFAVSLDGHEVEQIDGAVHLDGLHFLVESKDSGSQIDIAPVAKLRNQLLRRPPGTFGVLFARSGFTSRLKLWLRTWFHFRCYYGKESNLGHV